ncbi:MAG: hypothetical protein M0Q95_20805 [Porticoccaceae bacterium]|nr:hypothetical protein [Porticoccaceae bacterium]
MKVFISFFSIILGFSVLEANAFYCEKKKFSLEDYSSYLIVEGYVTDKPKNASTVDKMLKELRFNLKGTTNEFYKWYSYVDREITFFVTDSHNSEISRYSIVKLYEAEYPELLVGEKYILFLVGADGVNSGGYYVSPCAIIPLTINVNNEQYFFTEPPGVIRNEIIKKSGE